MKKNKEAIKEMLVDIKIEEAKFTALVYSSKEEDHNTGINEGKQDAYDDVIGRLTTIIKNWK